MSMAKLWGLTLLERNVRELSRLDFEEIVILTLPEAAGSLSLKHPLPASVEVRFDTAENTTSFDSLVQYLGASDTLVLVLQGNVLHDKRLLDRLAQTRDARGLQVPNDSRSAAAVLSAAEATGIHSRFQGTLAARLQDCLEAGLLPRLELTSVDPYIKHLRRTLNPFMIAVESAADLAKADETLRLTVHKGTNDFVAVYIHPPLEFALTRLLAQTKITPNQVTLLGMIFSSLAVYLFATGHLLAGILCAATKGILDGVDGKLARLHIKYSKFGDGLDHIGDIIFDALWYLALGWHFSRGDLSSTAAAFTMLLLVAYWTQRIVPGVFARRFGCEIYDYDAIDRFVRLIGSRMNNNVWVMIPGILLGYAQVFFYGISIWMAATALWYTSRLLYVSWRVSPQPLPVPPDQRL